VKIGNTSGADIDKFAEFGLTPLDAEGVNAPLIAECYGNFACRLYDDALIDKYNFFIFEVVSAQVATRPDLPETIHYTGDGVFTVSGKTISRRHLFRPGMLWPHAASSKPSYHFDAFFFAGDDEAPRDAVVQRALPMLARVVKGCGSMELTQELVVADGRQTPL
jgi:flavin reductase (DIM6/NTAB) family NADH-FMN oxidoreductase RutF